MGAVLCYQNIHPGKLRQLYKTKSPSFDGLKVYY